MTLPTSSTVDIAKDKLVELFNAIEFHDGKTLGETNTVINYHKALIQNVNTQVCVYSKGELESRAIENRTQKRMNGIEIEILVNITNREQQAELDLNYLQEKITEVIENNFNNSAWVAGELENTNFVWKRQSYADGFEARRLLINVAQRVRTELARG